tara:strand:+ start:416 stop:643 length:228 start_codon:yes stop_codon:yes gene_type:complete
MFFMSINKLSVKLKKLLNLLNIPNIDKISLNQNILNYCDSIKYIELIVELEKISKKKIGKIKIEKFSDIENFLKK